jgi:hypothetical protein
MDNNNFMFPTRKTRIGFHYYQDSLHYSAKDLELWLPELNALGASWLILQSSIDRAVPEFFISALVKAGIEPIIQFNLSLDNPPAPAELQTLLEAYSHWGVHGVLLFDRPNLRTAWQSSIWAQKDLVERFLDIYLPYANLCLQSGLWPIFPALEPGGSYWDTAFLRNALESLQRRKQNNILQNLVLSAYSWTGDHSLNWGSGGPQRWSKSRPYYTPTSEQDQRGFHIFDWYASISRQVLGRAAPILLLNAGCTSDPFKKTPIAFDPEKHANISLLIARLMSNDSVFENNELNSQLDPVPDYVLAANFWLLNAQPEDRFASQAWYGSEGQTLPAVDLFKNWVKNPEKYKQESPVQAKNTPRPEGYNIRHYLLLPTDQNGIFDWHLDVIRPFVKKYMPTVGFSIEEASMADRVTVIDNPRVFPEEMLEYLSLSGCIVDRISGDGMSIATQLAQR